MPEGSYGSACGLWERPSAESISMWWDLALSCVAQSAWPGVGPHAGRVALWEKRSLYPCPGQSPQRHLDAVGGALRWDDLYNMLEPGSHHRYWSS